jgi:hypothetical protein
MQLSQGYCRVLYVVGVVGCSLVYNDFNVTTSLTPGKQMRLCNDQWKSFAAFDKVAVVKGSKLASSPKVELEESQAMGLLQVLMKVDNSITVEQAIDMGLPRCSKQYEITSTQKRFGWYVGCRSIANMPLVVDSVYLLFGAGNYRWISPQWYGPGLPASINEGIASLPSLDDELMAALRSLPELRTVALQVGGGSLLPQFGCLHKLEKLAIDSYCLRGHIPKNLVANMPRLALLYVTPFEMAVGATDPAGGLCGLSGTLPQLKLQGLPYPGVEINLSNNQLTGQLPAGLLAFAEKIYLGNNRFSGLIPDVALDVEARTNRIDLSNNQLKVIQVTGLLRTGSQHGLC